MTINEKIIQAVSPYLEICVPDYYDGDHDLYATFTADVTPSDFYLDGCPAAYVYSCQLDLYAPPDQNILTLRKNIFDALSAVFIGCRITSDNDIDGQHYVFSFDEVVFGDGNKN